MKSISVKTKVKGSPIEIMSSHSKDLLKRTCPPFINLEINRYDGIKVDDEAHIVCSFFGQYQFWQSRVIDHQQRENEAYYTEKAIQMPAPFTYWKHIHKVEILNEYSSFIIDNITYSTGNKVLDILIYPIIYGLLFYRRPIYVDYFSD